MKSTGKRSRKSKILITIAAVIIVIAAAFSIYTGRYYRADDTAMAAVDSSNVETISEGYVFHTEGEPDAGLIFYPGGKVECESYAPLMQELSERGILCVLVRMPFNLAVFDINAADEVIGDYPEVDSWFIGGHSLGGAMSASYAGSHQDKLDGLVLLAAYSTADLSESDLSVISIYGSEDGVLNMDKYEAYQTNLPDDAEELLIEGGCHAGFGSYGAQSGDGTPLISSEEQIELTADAVSEIIDNIGEK